MYFFKKAITPFLLPMPVCFGIALLGLYFLWFTPKQGIGKILISIGFCALFLLSWGPFSHLLLRPLEGRYSCDSIKEEINLKFVVVLGGGCVLNPEFPKTSQLSSASLTRLIEGIQIYRKYPGAKLILTGQDVSKLMAETAFAIGIPSEDIIVDHQSQDTKDEAKNVKQIVQKEAFALITSASHIYRAMSLFESQGLKPYPIPTGHLVKGELDFSADMIFPNANMLYKSERACYEYMGLSWAKLRGQIK